MGWFGLMSPMSRTELTQLSKSQSPSDMYLRIPGRPSTYQAVRVMLVENKRALLMAADDSQTWVKLRGIFRADEVLGRARRLNRRGQLRWDDALLVTDVVDTFLN